MCHPRPRGEYRVPRGENERFIIKRMNAVTTSDAATNQLSRRTDSAGHRHECRRADDRLQLFGLHLVESEESSHADRRRREEIEARERDILRRHKKRLAGQASTLIAAQAHL